MAWNNLSFKILAIEVAVAIVLFTPIALVRQHEISKRPIVTASASDQPEIPGKGKTGPLVIATVEFDRPSKDGPVHCKITDQTVGHPWDRAAFDTRIHLAVRTDSCYDAVRVP
jgi:hypothetical protein